MGRRSHRAALLRRREQRRANQVQSSVGGSLSQSPVGIIITPDDTSIDLRVGQGKGFWAWIDGSGPTYSFIEITPVSSTSWVNKPGGRTGTAYEVKNLVGLAGRRVRLYPETGSFRFDWPMIVAPSSGGGTVPPPPCVSPLRVCLLWFGVYAGHFEVYDPASTLIGSCVINLALGSLGTGCCDFNIYPTAAGMDITIVGTAQATSGPPTTDVATLHITCGGYHSLTFDPGSPFPPYGGGSGF